MDHQLAITRGEAFVAFSRNAKAIKLPDGRAVLGPLDLSTLPHLAGDYAIRRVVVDGPMPGSLEIGVTEPPVVDGDVVLVRRTVAPMPAEMVGGIEAHAVEAAWSSLRAERDRRLTAATAILDRHRNQRDFGLPTTLTDAEVAQWAIYAQQLRDLPEETADPANPEWPIAPGTISEPPAPETTD